MPKYEMMYIMASDVSDDEAPAVAESIKKITSDFGGENIDEQQLGKKKLAYPVKKTRNGFYVVLTFDMDSKKVNEFDAKIRTQSSIIRYLLISLEEHMERMGKDTVAQAKMNRNQQAGLAAREALRPAGESAGPAPEVNAEELDKKIEEALTEDLTK